MVQEEKRVDLKDNTGIVCPHQGVAGVMSKKEEDAERERVREFYNTNMTRQEMLSSILCVAFVQYGRTIVPYGNRSMNDSTKDFYNLTRTTCYACARSNKHFIPRRTQHTKKYNQLRAIFLSFSLPHVLIAKCSKLPWNLTHLELTLPTGAVV
jgi:hypothetical protein